MIVKSWAKVPKDFLSVVSKVGHMLGHSFEDHSALDTLESVQIELINPMQESSHLVPLANSILD